METSLGVSFIVLTVVLVIILLLIVCGIVCFVLWHRKKAANISDYDYVFEENDTSDLVVPITEVSVRLAGEMRGVEGEYAGESIELQAGEEIILGRDPSRCMLVFWNPSMAGVQCGIRYDASKNCYEAKDYSCGSTTLSDGTLLTTSEYTMILPGTRLYIANGAEVFALL